MKTLFSFLCHQSAVRSFYIEDHVLPLCERCTGIYLGLGLSFIFLVFMRFYKKGFPPCWIIFFNIIGLSTMPIFGFHLIDPGPGWRLWNGLVFGNAIAFLLLSSMSIIHNNTVPLKTYSNSDRIWFWAFLIFLNTIPIWFPIPNRFFYYIVMLTILLGLICMVLCTYLLILYFLKKLSCSLKGFHNENPTYCQNPL